jgi:uncharacterized protein involved in exopolysaccharide biosynthesis/Mrp family chromosome partitioning ATPase
MRSMMWLRLGLAVAAGAAVGLVLFVRTPPVYQASASVLVGAAAGTAEVNMLTEAELVRSTQTTTEALIRLRADLAPAQEIGHLVAVDLVAGTSVLVIRYEASTPQAALAGATAFAQAYLTGRAQTAQAALDEQVTVTQRRLDEVRARLTEVNEQIAALPRTSAQLAPLQATAASLAQQSADLSTRLNELRGTPVDAGRVVGEPSLPTAPVRPVRLLYLGVGCASGLLAGLALDQLARRGGRRIRRADDLRRHRDIPLLADLDGLALTTGVGAGVNGAPAQQAFNRLRNEVVAAMDPTDRVVVVAAAAPGPASVLVAANLAAAFARAETDVVLVGASVPELSEAGHPVTLAGLFDLADIPGLTDVLAGRTSLSRALQRAARTPRLRVVTPGGTASATGLLQSEGARAVLRQLAAKTRYVLVEAPSTAAGADAQSLASAADVALLVVESGTRHSDVADAATQFARVGARLLGAVVVARLDTEDLPVPRDVPRTGRTAGRGPGPARGQGSPADYDTEGWIDSPPDALDGPTKVLEPVNLRPTGRLRDRGPRTTARRTPVE